jgi:hypothetical protein
LLKNLNLKALFSMFAMAARAERGVLVANSNLNVLMMWAAQDRHRNHMADAPNFLMGSSP